jgi:hypothetical protein
MAPELDERVAHGPVSDAELMRIAMGSRQTDVTSAPQFPKPRSNVVTGDRTVTLSQIVHLRCSAHG